MNAKPPNALSPTQENEYWDAILKACAHPPHPPTKDGLKPTLPNMTEKQPEKSASDFRRAESVRAATKAGLQELANAVSNFRPRDGLETLTTEQMTLLAKAERALHDAARLVPVPDPIEVAVRYSLWASSPPDVDFHRHETEKDLASGDLEAWAMWAPRLIRSLREHGFELVETEKMNALAHELGCNCVHGDTGNGRHVIGCPVVALRGKP